MDLGRLGRRLAELREKLDHTFLNDLEGSASRRWRISVSISGAILRPSRRGFARSASSATAALRAASTGAIRKQQARR